MAIFNFKNEYKEVPPSEWKEYENVTAQEFEWAFDYLHQRGTYVIEEFMVHHGNVICDCSNVDGHLEVDAYQSYIADKMNLWKSNDYDNAEYYFTVPEREILYRLAFAMHHFYPELEQA